MKKYISFLFVALAAVFNSVEDTLAQHFSRSVFRGLNPAFWNDAISWKTAVYFPFTKYKIDGWHLAKSAEVFCWCFAIIFYVGFFTELFKNPKFKLADWLAAGLIYISFFNLFYNHLLLF